MELSISQKFLLLAQHPVKGRLIINEVQLQYGIIGSLLLDMSLDKRLEIKNNLVYTRQRPSPAGSITSEIETMIRSTDRPRKLKYWVNKLSRRSKRFRRTIQSSLAKKKLIRLEKKKFLRLIPYQNSYLIGKRERSGLISKLREGLTKKRDFEEETTILLGLIAACKMYKVFSSDPVEIRQIKKTLKEIIKENPIAGTVDKTIQEVQTAIFATIIATSVVTSSASH
jgi:hypothetical protein